MRSRNIFLLLLSLSLTGFLFMRGHPLGLSVDGEEYLKVANALRDGSFWNWSDGPGAEVFMFHRLPVYPSLIAISLGLTQSVPSAVLLCHVLVTFAAFFLIGRLFSDSPRPWVSAVGVAIALVPLTAYSHYVLAEWFCGLALVMLWGYLLKYSRSKLENSLFSISLLSSVLCGMRAALVPALLFPAAVLLSSSDRRKAAARILVGGIPIILVIAANHYRFGVPKVSYLLGHQVAVMGALAGGTAAIPANDKGDFLRRFEESRVRVFFDYGISENAGIRYAEYLTPDHTLYTLLLDALFRARTEAGLTLQQADSLALGHGWQAIKDHRAEYIQLVKRGIIGSHCGIVLVLVVGILGAIRMSHLPRSLAFPTLVSAAFYFAYTLEISMLQFVIPRYTDLVFYPVCGLFIMMLSYLGCGHSKSYRKILSSGTQSSGDQIV